MKTGHSSTLKGTIWLISCPTLKKCLVKTNVVQFYHRLSSNILSHHRLNIVTVRWCATGCHWLQIFCNRMCSLTLNHLKLLRPLVVDLLKCFGMLAGGWLMTILLEYSQYRHSEYSWNTDQRSMNTSCGSASWHNGNPPRPSVLPLGLDLNFGTWEPAPSPSCEHCDRHHKYQKLCHQRQPPPNTAAGEAIACLLFCPCCVYDWDYADVVVLLLVLMLVLCRCWR